MKPIAAETFAAEVLRLREWGRVHFGLRGREAEADAAYGRAARVAGWQARSLAAEAALARVRALSYDLWDEGAGNAVRAAMEGEQ